MLALIAAGCSDSGTGPDDELPPGLPADITAADVEEGRSIFHGRGNCFQCHGQNGTGTADAPNLTTGQWLHIDGTYDAIVQLVTTGVPRAKQFPGFMPARGGSSINAEELRRVAAYVFTISRGRAAP